MVWCSGISHDAAVGREDKDDNEEGDDELVERARFRCRHVEDDGGDEGAIFRFDKKGTQGLHMFKRWGIAYPSNV